MKKLIVIAIFFLGIYATLTWYSGVVGERNFNAQAQIAREQLVGTGYSLKETDYQRGFFGSRISMEFGLGDAWLNADVPELALETRMSVTHGPVLFGYGPRFGAFGARGEVQVIFSDQELQKQFDELLGNKPLTLRMVGRYNNTGTAQFQVPQLSYSDQEFSFTLGESALEVHGDNLQRSFRGTVDIGDLEWKLVSGEQLSITPMMGQFDLTHVADSVAVGDSELTIDRASYSDGGMQFALNNLHFKVSQEMVEDRLNLGYEVLADSLEAPVAVTNLRYYTQINRLDLAAVDLWTDYSAGHTEEIADEQVAALLEALFREGLQFNAGMSAEVLSGTVAADLAMEYLGLPNDVVLSGEAQDIMVYLSGVEGNLLVKLAEPVVTETPLIFLLMEHIDQTLFWEDGYLVLRAEVKDGLLYLAGEPIPLSAFLPGTGPEPDGDDEASDGQDEAGDGQDEADNGRDQVIHQD